MTFTLIDVIKTAKIVKEINPNIKIILGGPHVIIYPTETIGIKEVDFVILGEAETVIKPLLDNINNPNELEKVKGLVFKKNGNIINTGRSDLIKNLDDLPFPARHLTNYKKYYWALFAIQADNHDVYQPRLSVSMPVLRSPAVRKELPARFRQKSG